MRNRIVLALAVLLAVALPSVAQAQCSVYKTWTVGENPTAADLNAAFTRTVDANTPQCVDDYSSTVAQMRSMVNPYPSSVESQATNLAGELERVRYQLDALVGKTYWYEVADNSVAKGVAKHWGATYTKYSEISDPSSPGSNELALYSKDNGAGVTVLAYKDSAGTVNTLTGPTSLLMRGHVGGLQSASNAVDPTNDIDVTVGEAASDDALAADRVLLTVAAAFTKRLDATFVVGTGNGMRDSTDTLVGAKTFHLYVIGVGSSSVDIFASTSLTPTLPGAYTKKRRIGSLMWDGAAIRAYDQHGDYFALRATVLSIDAANPGAAAISHTLAVPTGIIVEALLNYFFSDNTSANNAWHLSALDTNDVVPADNAAPLAVAITTNTLARNSGQARVKTNVSAQIRGRLIASVANTTTRAAVLGWYDLRGRNN